MHRKSLRIHRQKTALIVVDVQERLLPAIFEKERVEENCARLVKGAGILNLHLVITEQYRKGLGATVPEIAPSAQIVPMEKLTFSACGAPGFAAALRTKKVSDVILSGIESHVCVSQTCLDLLEQGKRVFIVADAISSRTRENWMIGIDRMRCAGAVIVSTEMLLFELVRKAGTDEFRKILALIK